MGIRLVGLSMKGLLVGMSNTFVQLTTLCKELSLDSHSFAHFQQPFYLVSIAGQLLCWQ